MFALADVIHVLGEFGDVPRHIASTFDTNIQYSPQMSALQCRDIVRIIKITTEIRLTRVMGSWINRIICKVYTGFSSCFQNSPGSSFKRTVCNDSKEALIQ